MPSLPDIVARMAPPSVRVAVTVAPATGSLAALVTMPTIVPDDALTTGAEVSSACAAGKTSPVDKTDIREPFRYFPFRYFRNFIDLIPFFPLSNVKNQIEKTPPTSAMRGRQVLESRATQCTDGRDRRYTKGC